MPRVAFITGAASGIGRALAARMVAAGHHVVLADRDPEVARVARAMGARGVELDVTDAAAVEAAVAACWARHGRLDWLFNNAGIGLAAEVRDTAPADWRRLVEVNLFGVIHGIQAVYPRMIAQGFGHIVNIASVAGLVALPGEAAYVASKHAVVGLSETLRAEAAALGVTVTTVCPGVVATPIYDTSPVIGFDKDRVLALWPKGISADACAAHILAGVRRKRALVVITPTAHLLWRVHRLAPSLFRRASQRYIQTVRRRGRT